MLAEGGIDEADVGEDLGGVGDLGEELQALFKVLCVVCGEGGSPGLELGLEGHGGGGSGGFDGGGDGQGRMERGRGDGW